MFLALIMFNTLSGMTESPAAPTDTPPDALGEITDMLTSLNLSNEASNKLLDSLDFSDKPNPVPLEAPKGEKAGPSSKEKLQATQRNIAKIQAEIEVKKMAIQELDDTKDFCPNEKALYASAVSYLKQEDISHADLLLCFKYLHQEALKRGNLLLKIIKTKGVTALLKAKKDGGKLLGSIIAITKTTPASAPGDADHTDEEGSAEEIADTKDFSQDQKKLYKLAVDHLKQNKDASPSILEAGFVGLRAEADKHGITLRTIIITRKIWRLLQERKDGGKLFTFVMGISGMVPNPVPTGIPDAVRLDNKQVQTHATPAKKERTARVATPAKDITSPHDPKMAADIKDFSEDEMLAYKSINILLRAKNSFQALKIVIKDAQRRGIMVGKILNIQEILDLLRARKFEDQLKEYLEFYSPHGVLTPKEKNIFLALAKMLKSYDWGMFSSDDPEWDIDRILEEYSKRSDLDFKKVVTCFHYGQSLIDIVICSEDKGTHDDDSKIFRKHGLLYVIQKLHSLGVPLVSIRQENSTLESLWKSESLEYSKTDILDVNTVAPAGTHDVDIAKEMLEKASRGAGILGIIIFLLENDPEVHDLEIKMAPEKESGAQVFLNTLGIEDFKLFCRMMGERYPKNHLLCQILDSAILVVGYYYGEIVKSTK